MTAIIAPVEAKNGCVNFTRRWALTRLDAARLVEDLETSSFITNIVKLFSNPIENVANFLFYPFDVTSVVTGGISYGRITIGNVQMGTTQDPVPGTDLGYNTVPYLDIGTVTINRYFNTFMDYAPYTKIEMYLPYVGFVTLDNDMVMGQTLSIKYAVSLETGNFTAYITRGDGTVVLHRDGQIGIQVQIGGGANAQIARNLLMSGLGLGTSMLTAVENPVAGIGMGLGAASSTINALQYHIQKSGQIGSNTALYGPQQAYIIYTRPSVVVPTSYNHDVGRPSGKSAVLSTLTGYTEVEKVHVEGTGLGSATKEEKEEIEKLLLSGVIF